MFTASVHQSQRTAQLTNKFIHSRWEFPIPWKTVTPRRYHLNRRNSFLWMWHWCYDFPQLPAYFSCRLCTEDQKVNAHHYHTDNKQNAEKKYYDTARRKKKEERQMGVLTPSWICSKILTQSSCRIFYFKIPQLFPKLIDHLLRPS